eukprot:TRINITY_DN6018_c0_g3_i1.p1 TRINITY_DN6018_c0_g3~~TRINITY_DN6018_c0_g3_i1.p1  ORF type:complete len:491 (-),score=113.16 TRINITY_DN6018_c0_g3_i1:359-1831(-)
MLDRLLRNQVVDKYKIMDVVGEGRFSKVKRAVNVETKAEVAVKIVDRKQLVADDMETELARELASMKRISSRHVVALLDEIYTPEKVYIFMELMKGGKLFDRIASDGKLKEAVARKYFKHLITGLEACHRLNICHRDLKPENLLLDENDNLKLSDFGFSCCTTSKGGEASLSVAYGTLSYMAPEMFLVTEGKLEKYCGKKCDIWSCGVILYVMLTGCLPWMSHDEETRKKLIRDGKFSIPPDITTEARELISGLLTTDGTKRPSLDEIKAHPWMAITSTTTNPQDRTEQSMPTEGTVSSSRYKVVPTESVESAPRTDSSRTISSSVETSQASTKDSRVSRPAKEESKICEQDYVNPLLHRSAMLSLDTNPMVHGNQIEPYKKMKAHFMTSLPLMDLVEQIDEVLTTLELSHQHIENWKIRIDVEAPVGKCSLLIQFIPAGSINLVHISRILGDFDQCDYLSSKIVDACRDIILNINEPEPMKESLLSVES